MNNSANIKERAKDIWIRARTNALANELSVKMYNHANIVITVFQSIFIVLPIIAVSLSLHFITSKPIEQIKEISIVNEYCWYLGLVAVLSNGIVLFLTLLKTSFRFNDKYYIHKELLSGYSLIAQKIRRYDKNFESKKCDDDMFEHLHDLFEILKAKGIEPSDKKYKKAQKILKTFNIYPFDIISKDISEISNRYETI